MERKKNKQQLIAELTKLRRRLARLEKAHQQTPNQVSVSRRRYHRKSQKQTEEALRQSEEHFRLAQEMSLDAFTILQSVRDEQGQIIDFEWMYVNTKAGQILRRTPQELIGQRLLQILPGNRENRALFDRYVQIVELGKGDEVELEYHAENIHGWFRNITVKLDDGIAVSFKDITERKQAELALQQSEKRFRALVEHSADAITLIGADGTIFYEGPTVTALTGYLPEERLNKNALDSIYPDDLPMVRQILGQVLAHPGMSASALFRSIRKDGSIWWTEGTATNLLHEPSVQAMVVNYRDVTERKRIEDRLIYLGEHDALTGIYNRAFFETELARLEHSRDFPASIIIGDLDHMKATNDTRGHAVGDDLLKRTALAIQSALRASDILARIGGDEFAVILPKTDELTAGRILLRIRDKLAEANQENQADPPLSLSLGSATATQGTLSETYKLADARMYAEKRK